jgi:hypothetical protein
MSMVKCELQLISEPFDIEAIIGLIRYNKLQWIFKLYNFQKRIRGQMLQNFFGGGPRAHISAIS